MGGHRQFTLIGWVHPNLDRHLNERFDDQAVRRKPLLGVLESGTLRIRLYEEWPRGQGSTSYRMLVAISVRGNTHMEIIIRNATMSNRKAHFAGACPNH